MMAEISLHQALDLHRELQFTKDALRSAVDEQDRLLQRNAELSEALAAMEHECDMLQRQLAARR
jgi:hypothetical protein